MVVDVPEWTGLREDGKVGVEWNESCEGGGYTRRTDVGNLISKGVGSFEKEVQRHTYRGRVVTPESSL